MSTNKVLENLAHMKVFTKNNCLKFAHVSFQHPSLQTLTVSLVYDTSKHENRKRECKGNKSGRRSLET